jgi:hypothetical protein
MKSTCLFLAACLCLTAATPAAEPKKKKAGKPKAVVDTQAVALIKPFDKDGDYEISADELKAMQSAYQAAPNGPLKELDRGNDGTLDYIDQIGINNKLGAAKMVEKPQTPPKGQKKAKK